MIARLQWPKPVSVVSYRLWGETEMFERYTEKARRVIFFARYEASAFGSPYIEPVHLLLGLFREDKALANRFLPSHAIFDAIREQIEAHAMAREQVSTSVDLPMNEDSKRALAFAAEEAPASGQVVLQTGKSILMGVIGTTLWSPYRSITRPASTTDGQIAPALLHHLAYIH